MPIINCDPYQVYINEDWNSFRNLLSRKDYSKIGVLVDENTALYCLPILQKYIHEFNFQIIEIKSGEHFKNLETCKEIWSHMLENGFDRHSLLINLGGGVIGDMGGFCARTFMRGMDFIQVPTTLLSQVDASVGGKLGIDFKDFKNLIGVIDDPKAVWIDDQFLKTLPARQLRSGFAEIIKHALIQNSQMWDELKQIENLENIEWSDIIYRSVQIKKEVVVQDKYEGGLRKILNFGHTLGHAIESENLNSEDYLLHGEAISIGMITESYISMKMTGLSKGEYQEIKKYILKIYPHFQNALDNEESILEKLIKDKKNKQGLLNFSLINKIGESVFDIVPEKSFIKEALLDYYKV